MDTPLTPEEFAGFVSCLAQITNIKVVFQNQNGFIEIDNETFCQMLTIVDPVLADCMLQWLYATQKMNTHITQHQINNLLPADPFRLGISGHVM